MAEISYIKKKPPVESKQAFVSPNVDIRGLSALLRLQDLVVDPRFEAVFGNKEQCNRIALGVNKKSLDILKHEIVNYTYNQAGRADREAAYKLTVRGYKFAMNVYVNENGGLALTTDDTIFLLALNLDSDFNFSNVSNIDQHVSKLAASHSELDLFNKPTLIKCSVTPVEDGVSVTERLKLLHILSVVAKSYTRRDKERSKMQMLELGQLYNFSEPFDAMIDELITCVPQWVNLLSGD